MREMKVMGKLKIIMKPTRIHVFKIIKRVFVMFLWVESGQFLHHPRIIIKPGKNLLKLMERPGNVVPKLKSCGK
jgi:hypothetical protein